MLIRKAELDNSGSFDIRCQSKVVTEIGPVLEVHRGEEVIDAGGGTLLSGLHGHHIHLYSLATAYESVAGPLNRWQLDKLVGDHQGWRIDFPSKHSG